MTTMLVHDPVERVDTMTMTWGQEARVSFLDHDHERAARGIVPDEVIDRMEGCSLVETGLQAMEDRAR